MDIMEIIDIAKNKIDALKWNHVQTPLKLIISK